MPKPPTRRSAVYGKKTPAPSMRFDKQLLADTKQQAAELKLDYTEYTERNLKFGYLLEKHKSLTPVLHYGFVTGQWLCRFVDGNDKVFSGPDPLAALEAALKAEE